jgi:hypothetical protein
MENLIKQVTPAPKLLVNFNQPRYLFFREIGMVGQR